MKIHVLFLFIIVTSWYISSCKRSDVDVDQPPTDSTDSYRIEEIESSFSGKVQSFVYNDDGKLIEYRKSKSNDFNRIVMDNDSNGQLVGYSLYTPDYNGGQYVIDYDSIGRISQIVRYILEAYAEIECQYKYLNDTVRLEYHNYGNPRGDDAKTVATIDLIYDASGNLKEEKGDWHSDVHGEFKTHIVFDNYDDTPNIYGTTGLANYLAQDITLSTFYWDLLIPAPKNNPLGYKVLLFGASRKPTVTYEYEYNEKKLVRERRETVVENGEVVKTDTLTIKYNDLGE